MWTYAIGLCVSKKFCFFGGGEDGWKRKTQPKNYPKRDYKAIDTFDSSKEFLEKCWPLHNLCREVPKLNPFKPFLSSLEKYQNKIAYLSSSKFHNTVQTASKIILSFPFYARWWCSSILSLMISVIEDYLARDKNLEKSNYAGVGIKSTLLHGKY